MTRNSPAASVNSLSPAQKAEISRLLTRQRPRATDVFCAAGIFNARQK